LAPAASSSRFSSKHVIATNSTGACSVCDFWNDVGTPHSHIV
jgi:hypothetical protein